MTKQFPRLLAAVLAALALPALARAQGPTTVSGTVTTATGTPVGFASVFLDGLGLGAQTRDDGKYTIVIPADRATGQSVTLGVRMIGYKPATAIIT